MCVRVCVEEKGGGREAAARTIRSHMRLQQHQTHATKESEKEKNEEPQKGENNNNTASER